MSEKKLGNKIANCKPAYIPTAYPLFRILLQTADIVENTPNACVFQKENLLNNALKGHCFIFVKMYVV